MLSSTRAIVRFPSQTILKAAYSTAKPAPPKIPAFKPLPPKSAPITLKPLPPSKQLKKDTDILNDEDFIGDIPPVFTSTPPVQPITKPIQPFATKKSPLPPSRVVPPRPTPTYTPTPTPSNPTSIPTIPTIPTTLSPAVAEILAKAAVIPPVVPTTTPTPATPTQAAAPTTSKPKAKKPAAPNAGSAKPAPSNAKPAPGNAKPAPASAKPAPTHAERTALARDLAGRSPAQLLTQIAQLQQHNATLQAQLVYHSAVDAIYGETGFNQLRNLISEFSEEESLALKTSGFDGDSIIQHLESKQRELCLQFTQTIGAELSKYPNTSVPRLKDQHRQSASAATATQQTLRNAGVPDVIIASTLTGLQPHLDELQIKIVRWEKLKADIDLLLATYTSNH